MLEEPEGKILLGEPENDHQVHNAKSQGGKERRATKERGKFPSKIPITFAFNTLHQFNWPH